MFHFILTQNYLNGLSELKASKSLLSINCNVSDLMSSVPDVAPKSASAPDWMIVTLKALIVTTQLTAHLPSSMLVSALSLSQSSVSGSNLTMCAIKNLDSFRYSEDNGKFGLNIDSTNCLKSREHIGFERVNIWRVMRMM